MLSHQELLRESASNEEIENINNLDLHSNPSLPPPARLRDSQGQFKSSKKPRKKKKKYPNKPRTTPPPPERVSQRIQEADGITSDLAALTVNQTDNMPSLAHQKKMRRGGGGANGLKSMGGPVAKNSAPEDDSPMVELPSPTPEDIEKAKAIGKKQEKKEDKTLERNIGDVCLGDTRFATWYPSWYPKEILGEKTLQLAEDGKSMGIVVPVLYICPMCFAYSKDGEDWKQHRKGCEKKNHIPGQEIYVKNRGKGKAEPYREGQWAIWEVDGAVDKTFCQKLSLFAKLFLDNKSVFFDVTTFKYFLYVHTFISKANLPSGRKVGDKQIIGFFSKEKMSWDNNNLACILIFPPWQRKGLGANLMGISYSIARREQIMGGPEKPISEMGRKGYRRYWGTEISRYLIDQYEEYCKQPKKFKLAMHISDISKATWIHPDDVLNTMREMNVVEKYDPPKAKGKGKDEGNGKGKEEPQAGAIDIDAIYKWVKVNKVKLDLVVDEDGFLPGYAEKVVEEVEE